MLLLQLLFTVQLIPLIAGSIAMAVYWTVVIIRINRIKRTLPVGTDGITIAESRTEPDIPILVVIPVHNEAGLIGQLIRSLREQDHERFHVVLCLDRCTDGTAAVAKRETDGDHRFEIVEIDECPDGWTGKVNAVRVGVERSAFTPEAELLLFTDADCVFHPSCLRAAAALAEERSLDLLSFLSEYPAESWFELFVQPAAGFELMRQYPLLRANRNDERQRPFANGQFMLFRASFYRNMGGHAVVRDELLEDLALGRAVKQNGGRAGVLMGGGIVRCRMYETWDEFCRGWKRIYKEAAQRRSSRLRSAGKMLMLTNVLLPITVLVLGITATWACVGLGGSVGICLIPMGIALLGLGPYIWAKILIYRMARVSLLAVPVSPLGAWLVSRLLFEAARELSSGEPTIWGGREYVREDRSGNSATTRRDMAGMA